MMQLIKTPRCHLLIIKSSSTKRKRTRHRRKDVKQSVVQHYVTNAFTRTKGETNIFTRQLPATQSCMDFCQVKPKILDPALALVLAVDPLPFLAQLEPQLESLITYFHILCVL